MDEVITLQFDGGSRGNPGPAGIGVVLKTQDGTPIVTLGRFVGRATNNVAEYKALITALEEAQKLGATKIIVRGDSELIIKQMKGEYRVKHPDLRPLYESAQGLVRQFKSYKIEHNYREDNTLADKLANLAMDRRRDVTDVDGDDGGAPTLGSAMVRGSAGKSASAQPVAATTTRPLKTSSASPAPAVLVAPPSAGQKFACSRCGCKITVDEPSSKDSTDLGPFGCICGVRMKAIE